MLEAKAHDRHRRSCRSRSMPLLTLHLSQALASPRGPKRDASELCRTPSMATTRGVSTAVHPWDCPARVDLRAPIMHGPRSSQAMSSWATSGRKRAPAQCTHRPTEAVLDTQIHSDFDDFAALNCAMQTPPRAGTAKSPAH